MPIKYNGLSRFDTSTVKFLKIKSFKSFPGGIFSIIFSLLNLALLVTTVLLFILEPTKMNSKLLDSKAIKTLQINQNEDKINIMISSKQEANELTFNYINSHYKLIEYYKKEPMGTIIYGRLYQGKVIQLPSASFALDYSIPSSDVISQEKSADFPRLGIENCALLKSSSLPFFIVLENTDMLNDCIIDDDPMLFYDNENIRDKIFSFGYSTDYSVLEPDYSIKSSIKTYDIGFSFQYDQFDSYITELNRINLMNQGSQDVNEYINWLTPDYQVLTQFNINNHYSFHVLFTTDYNDLVVLFVFYKNGFLYYLQLLGTLCRVVDLLLFIPAIWTPYYSSLVIIKYFYMKKKKENNDDLDLVFKDYDWENMKYCEWLSIRFGCSSRKNRLNEELIKMRTQAIKQYESLYSTPNKENQDNIIEAELQIKDDLLL